MEKIIVRGGHKLNGTVEIEGAKNAVLPILAAGILPSEGRTFLTNVPILSDVYTMNNVIRFLTLRLVLTKKIKRLHWTQLMSFLMKHHSNMSQRCEHRSLFWDHCWRV